MMATASSATALITSLQAYARVAAATGRSYSDRINGGSLTVYRNTCRREDFVRTGYRDCHHTIEGIGGG